MPQSVDKLRKPVCPQLPVKIDNRLLQRRTTPLQHNRSPLPAGRKQMQNLKLPQSLRRMLKLLQTTTRAQQDCCSKIL